MRSLSNLGNAYFYQGEYEKSLNVHQKSLSIAKINRDRSQEARCLNTLGLIYRYLGHYNNSVDYLHQSIKLKQEIGDEAGQAGSLSNIGITYFQLGQYKLTISYLEKALDIAKKHKRQREEANCLMNLGIIYATFGIYEQAIEYFQQSLFIHKKLNSLAGEVRCLNNLGIAFGLIKNHEEAIIYFKKSLLIFQNIGESVGEASCFSNLGNCYSQLNEFKESIKLINKALDITRNIKNLPGEASSINNLGNVYARLGKFQKAINLHKQSLKIAREIKDNPGIAQCLTDLGNCLFNYGQITESEECLYQAIAVLESLRIGLDDSYSISIFDTQTNAYNLLQKVLIKQNKPMLALEISERSRTRALVELMIENSNRSLNSKVSQNFLDIERIKNIARIHEVTIIEYSLIEYKTFEEKQSKKLIFELIIWLITSKGEVICKSFNINHLTESNSSLNRLTELMRESIGAGRGNYRKLTALNSQLETNLEELKQLHKILIEPILQFLPDDPDLQIIFIPQGTLFLVPFAALCDESGQYLIEKHTISIAPSIQTFELSYQSSNTLSKLQIQQLEPENVLVVGNPQMPTIEMKNFQSLQTLTQLPGAEQEAQEIASLFDTKPLIGIEATKSNVLSKMVDASVIHFATHGLLDDVTQVDIPGILVFTPSETDNGLLSASEILQLSLDAELVVLSACDTGKGKITGDSVVGLSRSFMVAGVPSLIVSLWSVYDTSTAFLMRTFYSKLFQDNLSKAQALRSAMLATLKKYPQEPRAWAAFTLIGKPE